MRFAGSGPVWQGARNAGGEKHLLEAFAGYLQGADQHVEDREKRIMRTVHTYMETRRKDCSVRLCFSPSELHLSIPDEVFYHPVVKELW